MEEKYLKELDELIKPFEKRYKKSFKIQSLEDMTEKLRIILESLSVFLEHLWNQSYWFFGWQGTSVIAPLTLTLVLLSRTLFFMTSAVATLVGIGYLAYGCCLLLQKLSHVIEVYTQDYLGQDISSNRKKDLSILHSFLKTILSDIEQVTKDMSSKELQQRYQELERLQTQGFSKEPELSAHLKPLIPALHSLCAKAITEQFDLIRKRAHELYLKNTPDSRENFTLLFHDYVSYRKGQQEQAVLAYLQGQEWQNPALLRDKITDIFTLFCENSTAESELSWPHFLCELLREEASFLYGPEIIQSEDFEDWIGWLGDKMRGIESEKPSNSCPYFYSYDASQWDNIAIALPEPIILSKNELLNTQPHGENDEQRQQNDHSMAQ